MRSNKNDSYLLIDYNQVLYHVIFTILKNEDNDEILENVLVDGIYKKRLTDDAFNFQFRNFFWNTFFGIVSRFENLKQVIICCEGRSWRKKVFPYYKSLRNETRSKDDFDWKYFYEIADQFRKEEVEKYGPFIVVGCYDCEGDDIVGVLSVALSKQYPKSDVIIYSNDKDFKQLLKYQNIKLFSSMKNSFIESSSPKNDLLQLILTGDRSDGIPNVYCRDDVFVNPDRDADGKTKKCKGLGEVTARKAILENSVREKILKTPEIEKNFERNKLLIDLSMIPKDIQENVKEEYKKQVKLFETKSSADLFKYFINEGLVTAGQSISKVSFLF